MTSELKIKQRRVIIAWNCNFIFLNQCKSYLAMNKYVLAQITENVIF